MDGNYPTFETARSLLERGDKHPVFLHIEAKEKGPEWPGWAKTTYQDTLRPFYQEKLRIRANTGVLLGAPSDHLCAIDCDTEPLLAAFVKVNPAFQNTLRSRGERGGQFWGYVEGKRPRQIHPLKVDKNSPLALGCKKKPDKDGNVTIGEFRAEGGQSIICGVHPNGDRYTWPVASEPITIDFDQIVWPDDIIIPWEPARTSNNGSDHPGDPTLLKRAVDAVTIDHLWEHFGLEERSANPVCSPFRPDKNPSFSIYDQGRRFKDHSGAYPDTRGDSFDFYQRKTGLTASAAFVPFVELAGLGHELKKNKTNQGKSQASAENDEPDLSDEELMALHQTKLDRYRLKDRNFPEPMSEEAFHGVAGDIARVIEPTSEASKEAILAQLLVALGNMIGRGPHRKQAGFHRLNEFTVLVGETAIGRKGTSWTAVQSLLGVVSEEWLSTRMRDGFQSGEAIVHSVRDTQFGTIPINKRKAGFADQAEETILDHGVDDKRLLIVEEEFARLLTVSSRPGNTLSVTLRKAWDGKKWLYVEGKIAPEKATGAHVSMIGHITSSELAECLRSVENKNGFSNRVLWIASRRVGINPIPLWVDWHRYPEITNHLSKVIETFGAGTVKREMAWSQEAERLWRAFYRSIPDNNAGIVGSIIARSDAHVLRLTMLFAVLDNATLMKPEHLKAAIAFWRYCERSATWAFGEKTGNKAADQIYWMLQREPKGISRTDLNYEVFNNHASKTTLDLAFSILVDAKLAYFMTVRSQTSKKPSELWFASKGLKTKD